MQLVLSRDARYLEIIIRITDFITGFYKKSSQGSSQSKNMKQSCDDDHITIS
jgi:hypothetical protein